MPVRTRQTDGQRHLCLPENSIGSANQHVPTGAMNAACRQFVSGRQTLMASCTSSLVLKGGDEVSVSRRSLGVRAAGVLSLQQRGAWHVGAQSALDVLSDCIYN